MAGYAQFSEHQPERWRAGLKQIRHREVYKGASPSETWSATNVQQGQRVAGRVKKHARPPPPDPMRAACECSTIPDAPLLSLDFTELAIMKVGIPKAELKLGHSASHGWLRRMESREFVPQPTMPPTRTSSERTNRYDARAAGRSQLPMANKVVSHTKPRFDINASLSEDEPLVVIFFTAAELAKLDARNILGNIPCTKCCLDVATWGFGAYIYNQKTGTIESSVSVCKACYAYEHANPQKDEDEELILLMRTGHCLRAPKCTCPEGSEACQEPFTGCELHQIPAMVPAPPGVRKMHRPAKRQQLREHVEAIMVHYDDAVTQSQHRLNFHSAMWDRRDRLDQLDSLDQLDLEDRKRKWNAYQTALLAVKSAEAAAERANKLVDDLSTLAYAAPVDSLREKGIVSSGAFHKVFQGCGWLQMSSMFIAGT
ncbi:hypothetical protein C8R45DRAFT_937268 [Mycena sanguinolenta]|nr:hypothetical protein C8R45DRAFT_937268 [Mycena sanguinolenta]